MEIFLFWFIGAIIVGIIAYSKARFGIGYFFLSLILTPILIGILVLVLPSLKAQPIVASSEMATPDSHVRCPACAEFVLPAAAKCKHCGVALVPDHGFHQRQASTMAVAKKEDSKNLKIGIGFIVSLIFLAWLIDKW